MALFTKFTPPPATLATSATAANDSLKTVAPVATVAGVSTSVTAKQSDIKYLVEPRSDVQMSPPITGWCPEPKAWLTDSGELRTQGIFHDLAGEIIRLTSDCLQLQATILLRHCGQYSGPHWKTLAEEWYERAAIMEYDGKLSRSEAEYQAADQLRCIAFLDKLRRFDAFVGDRGS